MARRRYRWRHPLHHVYILHQNAQVRIERGARSDGQRWQLTIAGSSYGFFPTFARAELAIPDHVQRGLQ